MQKIKLPFYENSEIHDTKEIKVRLEKKANELRKEFDEKSLNYDNCDINRILEIELSALNFMYDMTKSEYSHLVSYIRDGYYDAPITEEEFFENQLEEDMNEEAAERDSHGRI